jgi:hypothetical protein
VVAAARSVDDRELGRIRERLLQERLERFDGHGEIVASAVSLFRRSSMTRACALRRYARSGEEDRGT